MNDDLSIFTPDDLTARSKPFKPAFEPFNDAAKRMVSKFHEALDLPTTPKRRPKYENALASFFATFQDAFANGGDCIGVLLKDSAYSDYDNGYGKDVIKHTYSQLIAHGTLTLIRKGERVFEGDKRENGKTAQFKGYPTICQINELVLNDDDFWKAEYIETGLQLVQLGQNKTKAQKQLDAVQGRKRAKVRKKDMSDLTRHFYQDALPAVKQLKSFWRHHPLMVTLERKYDPVIRYSASVTRIFHNNDFYKGGRFYGSWTNLRSSTRLKATIKNEPVAEIDIRASQPTLLSLFTGKMMKVSSAKDKNMESTWDDIYDLIGRSMHKNARSLYDAEHRRAKIKKCIMTMIGRGNPHSKKIPRLENDDKFTFSDKPFGKANNEFEYLCERSRYIVPALYSLGKTLNGQTLDTHFLSYHESEVILATIRGLHAEGIPAYPMHDCLIVPRSKAIRAATVLRDTIMDYSNRLTSSNHYVLAPLTIERHGYEALTLRGSLIEHALPPSYP